jgi:hypothetical protein
LSNKVDQNQIIREYLNYEILRGKSVITEHLVLHFDSWFQESVVSNQPGISLYIEIELCDKTLDDVIKELKNDSILKSTESLTAIAIISRVKYSFIYSKALIIYINKILL